MGFIKKKKRSLKDTIREINAQPQKGRKFSQHFYLTKDLDPECLTSSNNSIIKRQIPQLKQWGKDLNRHFTRG